MTEDTEPVTEQDIKNWRKYFSLILPEKQKGGDIFIQHCMNTIESLRAELEAARARIAELELEVDSKLSAWEIMKNNADRYKSRVAELEESGHEETRQFNLGHDAYLAGESEDSQPHFEHDYDMWIVGYAWAKFLKPPEPQP